MIQHSNKSPSLKTKEVEMRSLIPFAVLIAKERNDAQKTEHARTVSVCAASLLDVYMLMSLEGCSPNS